MTEDLSVRAPLILAPGTELHGVSGQAYVLESRISGGMQGVSYTARSLSGGDKRTYFIKTPFTDVHQLPEAFQDRNGRIMATFTREYQNRKRLGGVSGVAPVLDIGIVEVDPSEEVPRLVPFIVQEFVAGMTLDEYLKEKYPATDGEFRGIDNYAEWAQLARQILLVLKRVHNRNVVHGDIWPRNIVIADDEPLFVDFGSSFLLDQDFQLSGGSIRRHHYLAPERLDQTHGWYVPADIFSMGGVLFFMACGKPPDESITHKDDLEALKAYTIRELNRLNPGLLQQNVGAAKIVDKCLRHDPSDRFPYVESILEALDIFGTAPISQNAEQSRIRVDAGLGELAGRIESLHRSGAILFMDYTARQIEMLSRQVEGMSRGHHELIGAREELINSLLRYLGALGKGHKYLTVTVPAYWRPENLGIDGRFLAMNKLMALRGVTVKRVFLLCEEDTKDQSAMAILRAHVNACLELADEGVDVDDKVAASGSGKRVFYTGYKLVKPEERDLFISSGDQVAIWRGPDDRSTMSMNFTFSTASRQEIGKIRFWSSPDQEPILRKIEQQIADSQPLKDFLSQLESQAISPRTAN